MASHLDAGSKPGRAQAAVCSVGGNALRQVGVGRSCRVGYHSRSFYMREMKCGQEVEITVTVPNGLTAKRTCVCVWWQKKRPDLNLPSRNGPKDRARTRSRSWAWARARGRAGARARARARTRARVRARGRARSRPGVGSEPGARVSTLVVCCWLCRPQKRHSHT